MTNNHIHFWTDKVVKELKCDVCGGSATHTIQFHPSESWEHSSYYFFCATHVEEDVFADADDGMEINDELTRRKSSS